MANTHETLHGLFAAIADAIRGKTGGTAEIVADQFPQEIAKIETGIDTSDATAAEGDIRSGQTAYVNGKKIIGKGTLKEYAEIEISGDSRTIYYVDDSNSLKIASYGMMGIRIRVPMGTLFVVLDSGYADDCFDQNGFALTALPGDTLLLVANQKTGRINPWPLQP